MTRTVLIIAFMCGCCIAAAVPCPAQAVSDTSTPAVHSAVLDWAREHAIVLDTIEPGSNESDLEPFSQLIGDARIVLLGDSRHDAREQWVLKHRLIEYLIKNMGFSVLAMEESLPCTSLLNACLLGERDEMGEALSEMGGWYLWDTEELLALMSSLRAHNTGPTSDIGVRVYGFDISDGARRGVENALALLEKSDTGSAGRLRRAIDLTPFSENFWPQTLQNYRTLTPEAADSLGAGLMSLVETLRQLRDDMAAQSGITEYEWALRQAIVAKQAHDMMLMGIRGSFAEVGTTREAAMVDNLSWLLRVAAPGEKIIVWAHNFHVAREPQYLDVPGRPALTMEPLGHLLAKEFGDSMVSIGFSFERGVDSSALKPAPKDWVDGVLAEVGPDAFILDFREVPPEGPAHDWFQADQTMRGEGGSATLVPAKAFDAVAFVREVGPITRTAGARMRFMSLSGQ